MNLQVFQKDDFSIRVIHGENNEPLFCLSDVCKILEIQDTYKAKQAILKEFELPSLCVGSFDTGFGVKEFTMVDEAQLYFVLMRSDKPKAREFRMWVNQEVLPSIRKQGAYISNESYSKMSKEFHSLLDELKLANSTKNEFKTQNDNLKDELLEVQRKLLSFYESKGLKGLKAEHQKPYKLDEQTITKIKELKAKGFGATKISRTLAVSRVSVYKYTKDLI